VARRIGEYNSQSGRAVEDKDADAASCHTSVSGHSFIGVLTNEQLTCWECPKTQISFNDAFGMKEETCVDARPVIKFAIP